MNPPTSGHEQLVNTIRNTAKRLNAPHELVLSGSNDAAKNPLTPDQKLTHARNGFPDTNISMATPDQPSLVHHLTRLSNAGHDDLHMVAGSDRIPEFQKLVEKYNGKPDKSGNVPFSFKKVEFHSAGERDPDSDGVSGVSGTKMRAFAKSGDYDSFKKGAPSSMADSDARAMFSDVQAGMGKK